MVKLPHLKSSLVFSSFPSCLVFSSSDDLVQTSQTYLCSWALRRFLFKRYKREMTFTLTAISFLTRGPINLSYGGFAGHLSIPSRVCQDDIPWSSSSWWCSCWWCYSSSWWWFSWWSLHPLFACQTFCWLSSSFFSLMMMMMMILFLQASFSRTRLWFCNGFPDIRVANISVKRVILREREYRMLLI